jgi:hypothetical protein
VLARNGHPFKNQPQQGFSEQPHLIPAPDDE